MASVVHMTVESGFLNAGASHVHTVPNVPSKRVWAFSAEGDDFAGQLLVGTIAFEITKVVCRMGADSRSVDVTVKNSGTVAWGYTLRVARIGP